MTIGVNEYQRFVADVSVLRSTHGKPLREFTVRNVGLRMPEYPNVILNEAKNLGCSTETQLGHQPDQPPEHHDR